MFRFKKPRTGKYTEVLIGPWPECSYSFASQTAAQLLVMVLKGDDPVVEARKREGSKTPFAKVWEEWTNHHRSRWRSLRHVRVLRKHCQRLADVAVDKIVVREELKSY